MGKNKRVQKPWGFYENLLKGKNFRVKLLFIRSRQRLSLQRHKLRDELWIPLAGNGRIELGNLLSKGTFSFPTSRGPTIWIPWIPRNCLHRLIALKDSLRVLEVSFGKFLERDIEMVEDDYGRIKKKKM